MSFIDRGSRIRVLQDVVLAVAIGAQRSLGDTLRQGLPVNTRPVLIHDIAMAQPASIDDRRAKRRRFRRQQLVRASVTHAAIGRAFITVLARLPMDAIGVFVGLVLMARNALGLGNVIRMRERFVAFVAGVAGQPGMRALLELLPLFVAGDAFCRLLSGARGNRSRRAYA